MRAILKSSNLTHVSFSAWSKNYAAYSHSDATKIFLEIAELRKKLQQEGQIPLNRMSHIFEISEPCKDFLQEVTANSNKKYSRGGKNGEGYVGIEELLSETSDYYDEEAKERLLQVSDMVQDRMRVKVSLEHMIKVPQNAVEANPALKIVMPNVREIENLEGEIDPSNQNRYSPMAGLLHKYEMLLALVSVNCSSHCRYCYRLDLFNGTSNKSKADMPVIAAYIKTYNELIDEAIKNHGRRDKETGLWLHKETGEPLIHAREILFSGGDPMTLPNATLARYMALMSEAGINTIRIGTKELVFNPSRFDTRFWEMMDELLEAKVDREGNYLYDINLNYRVRKDIKAPLTAMKERSEWLEHYNQFPIIAGVNDSAEVLRLLIYQSHRLGINMHNIYACREIQGNQHFRADNTIDAQYKLLERAKVGLSGLKNHSRLVMSTEYGKVEICGVEEGNILLRLNRFIHGNKPEQTIIKVNPQKLPEGQKFYWLTEEVIDTAVSDESKKILTDLRNEDNSLIKQIKKAAAATVINRLPQNDNEEKSIKTSDKKVIIEVFNRNGGSKFIYIDLADEKYQKNPPTLATILAEEKEVEAACKEQLSCSTCVGEVESSNPIPEAKEDEADLIDSVAKDIPSTSAKPRATCQIALEPGSYKFTKI